MRKGQTPAASARPSVQGGRPPPSPLFSANTWNDYFEERPSILSLCFVVVLTALFIGSLVTSLYFAYALEVQRRPPSTTATPSVNESSIPQAVNVTVAGLPTAATTVNAKAARKATGHLPRGASGGTSRRAKKRGRRKKTSTSPYTSSSSSFEGPEGATTATEMERGRIANGGGRPALDTTKATARAGTVSNASRSTLETSSVSLIARKDAARTHQSRSPERTTTTTTTKLDELANNTTLDAAATTSPAAAASTPIAPFVERTGGYREDAAFGVGEANSTTRSGMIDEVTAPAGFVEETGMAKHGGNETKAAVPTPRLAEWTELRGHAAVGSDSTNTSGSEPDDESTEGAAGLDEETGTVVQGGSAETEATENRTLSAWTNESFTDLPSEH
ncbi:mucin-21-like [Dermacentor albipictus]|uniref:mucin-21-like n=1 Tax=Dermacentor albipictus TaxID=60249 RepID=UPI0031FC9A7C